MADIETVLYTKLSGTSGISDLVATRVYPVKAPDQPTAPFIRYVEIDEPRMHGMTEDHGIAMPRIQIDCYAATHAAAKAVAAAVKAALQRWSDAATSPAILDAFFDTQRSDYESEVKLFVVSQDWVIWNRE